ncbi:MFS transporter [Sphaerisporangium krabiense]|uniref:MFS family permease n=1 Tax=Sphaerisporangium krabiense TaxID=763782 RepID=A0A7W9DUS4_9ACTN|nr:MFS transporter [Sphaerisporangium krabiense]MBB5630685.1 MFS family permease [Sphaerisporangium krabiense]GII67448.1 MFS transporter [Sphaerisporangium krabiense]
MTSVTTSSPTAPGMAAPSAGRGAAWLLGIVLTGQFMAILDVSIVNVAAPTIRADLGASGSGLQLVISGYTIAYAMLLITGARLGGLAGPRRMFLIGLAVFTAASLACGLAGSEAALIAFRLAQGVGSAFMVPQVLSIIQLHFTGAARVKAIGAYSAVLAGGVVAGQVAGGALVSADLLGMAWRPVFLVNVPIGAALLAVGLLTLPRAHTPGERGLDPAGLVTLSLAVTLLVVPLVLGREQGWPAWGRWSMAASAVLAVVFVLVERRARHPLIPGRLLRAPGLVPSTLGVFGAMVTWGGFLFSVALHLQAGLGHGPLAAGVSFVPGAAGFAIAGLNWRRVPARLHRPMILVGFAASAAGYLGVGWSLASGGDGMPWFMVAFTVAGAGLGLAYSPLMTMALQNVAPRDAADASGLMATMLQLGQVVGVATFGSLFLGLAPSAHAVNVTATGLAVTAVAAGACALPLLRRGG